MSAPMRKISRCFFCQSFLNSRLKISLQNRTFYSTQEIKKFYKHASISKSDGLYEINLDKYKLKTPGGSVFHVANETLALAVATEWNSQDKVIHRHSMHLTMLCNTAIDNPSQRSREDFINSVIKFLETDTICYRLEDPPELAAVQRQQWDPIVDWFRHRYNVRVEPTTGLACPNIPLETVQEMSQHLRSYSDWAIFGIWQVVDSIKSLILGMALVERCLTVEQTVKLARLEQEFQIQQWGNVDWYHDMDLYELRSRLAAATLFVHWTSENTTIKRKADFTITNIAHVAG